jgi:hypothetical protein
MSERRTRPIINKKPDQEILTNCSKVNQKKGINQRTVADSAPIIPSGKGSGKKAIMKFPFEDDSSGLWPGEKRPDLTEISLPQFDEEFGKQVPKKRKIEILTRNSPR